MKRYQQICLSALLFFVITMPFREFFQVMAVTEMRPVSALPPTLGLLFGYPGALGCAIGNLAADIFSGYGPLLCFLGFIAQFLYGILPYLAWYGFKEKSLRPPGFLRLDSVKKMLRYIVIVILNSAVMAAMFGLLMWVSGLGAFWSTADAMVFLNNVVFCIVLGIPIIIFTGTRASGSVKSTISLNERLILIFILLGVISAALIGCFAYMELSRYIPDPLSMWNRIYLYIIVALTVFYTITVLFLRYAEKTITVPVESIAGIAKNYIDEDAGKMDTAGILARCETLCSSNSEIKYLAEGFRQMVQDLDTYIVNLTTVTAEKERIGAELHVAAQIQADMLPVVFPDREEFQLNASMVPAKEVGGDFYDFFFVDQDHLAVVIGDVSGKGVPAALFMVITRLLIKNHAQSGAPPEEVFASVNEQLCENNQKSMFVTGWMGVLELSTGRLTFVNAGHNPPLVKRGQEFTYLKSRAGFVLAGMEETRYKQNQLSLQPGDGIFLYTDGVTEAADLQNQLFGEEKLLQALARYKEQTPVEILGAVKEEVRDFAGEAKQSDDITMLYLTYKGRGHMKQLALTARLENLERVTGFIDEAMADCGCPPKLSMQIRLAAEEVYVNICHYAYGPESGPVKIQAGPAQEGNAVEIVFTDSGLPFDPLQKKDPDLSLPAAEREIGGLGIFMVKTIMDQIHYTRREEKNILTLKKDLTTGGTQ